MMQQPKQIFKTLFAIVVLLGFSEPIFAQSLASLDKDPKISQMPDADQDLTKSLQSVLNELEANHKVHFNYASELVKDKFIQYQAEESENLENELKKILLPLGLQHEKVKENLYLIIKRPLNIEKIEQNKQEAEERRESFLLNPLEGSKISRLLNVQQQTITGKVTDQESGEPLPGVNVLVKGTNIGTVTDVDGNYNLNVPNEDDILVFSSIGYIAQEVPVNGRTTIDVTLAEDVQSLEEVVVVGYGTQKRTSLTSALSEIDGEALARRPVPNARQALQGMAPGVIVRDFGGAPGQGDVSINIRGITTLGNNEPLVIVDGIEQRISDLDPNDIESMTVLKDASSTAIYGSRAANGVILITTKGAIAGEVRVNYDAYYAIQKSINHPTHMGLEDYMRAENLAYINAGMGPKYTEAEIQEYINATDRFQYPLPNTYHDLIFSPAPQQRHTLTVSGGSEKIRTLLSLKHFEQDGVTQNFGSDLNEVRLKTDFAISDRIQLSTNLNYRRKKYYEPADAQFGPYGVYQLSLHASNWAVPRYPDGTYGVSAQGYNPLIYAEALGRTNYTDDYLVANFNADIDLLEGLKFSTRFGAEVSNNQRKAFVNELEIRDYYDPTLVVRTFSPNELSESRNYYLQTTLNNILEYNKQFGIHNLTVLAGHSEVTFQDNGISASRTHFINNSVQVISQGSEASRDNAGFESEWALRSFFGRINYNLADKYLLELNGRYDGSSRFSEENRYSFFPSLSVGWRISEENFWSPIENIISNFKVRGSWGQTGNQTVGLYSNYAALVATNYAFGNEGVDAIIQRDLANKDLTWETTTQTNIGFDAYFLNNRLSLTFDYYNKRTENILLSLPIPSVVGLIAPPQNAGVVENRGWELALAYRNSEGAFTYNISANLTDNVNEVIDLEGTGPYISGTTINPMFVIAEGLPIDTHWGYKTDGLFQSEQEIGESAVLMADTQPGDVKYVDLNNDGRITPEDMTNIGISFPRYIFGLSADFTYQNFNLFFQLQGAGEQSQRLAGAWIEGVNREGFTSDIYANEYWTEDNRDARFPRPIRNDLRNVQASDRLLTNASYVRLKDLRLSYTLPENVLPLDRARVYVSATNLFTISALNEWGLDPEAPSGRTKYFPQTGLYTLGLNLTF